MATLNKVRPSKLMGIEDDAYAAWCLDEACMYMVNKARFDKKEPDFDRPRRLKEHKDKETTNSAALAALAALGVKANM